MNYVPRNSKKRIVYMQKHWPAENSRKSSKNLKRQCLKDLDYMVCIIFICVSVEQTHRKFKHPNLKNSTSQARWPKTTTRGHVKHQKMAQIKACHRDLQLWFW